MECQDGCVTVEKIIRDVEEEDDLDRWDIIDNEYDRLKDYKCFQCIKDDEYGHINYAVAAYAVCHDHLDCLKKLHKDLEASWHADLAIVAAERNSMTCLKYIMEHMGDVFCGDNILNCDISQECQEYISDICKNCDKNKLHVLINN